MEFMPGDFVKINHPNGSVARVTEVTNGVVYLRYHYGLDRAGEPMTATGAINPSQLYQLVLISELDFWKVAARKGWGSD